MVRSGAAAVPALESLPSGATTSTWPLTALPATGGCAPAGPPYAVAPPIVTTRHGQSGESRGACHLIPVFAIELTKNRCPNRKSSMTGSWLMSVAAMSTGQFV